VESKWKNYIITSSGDQSGGKLPPHSDLRGGGSVSRGETPHGRSYSEDCKQKLEGRTEMTGRRGRRRKQLLDNLKEKIRYWKLKEKVLDRTLWRTRFGRGYGPVIKTDYRMNG
jgi:hypothetical protein